MICLIAGCEKLFCGVEVADTMSVDEPLKLHGKINIINLFHAETVGQTCLFVKMMRMLGQ